MSMMKMILSSDNVVIEERKLVELKEEVEYLNAVIIDKEKKLEKLKNSQKK
jgi:hypothetical protein